MASCTRRSGNWPPTFAKKTGLQRRAREEPHRSAESERGSRRSSSYSFEVPLSIPAAIGHCPGVAHRLSADRLARCRRGTLDELLPVAAVAGKARDLFLCRKPHSPCQGRARRPSGQTGACDAASGRVTETVIDRLHRKPAERRQAVVHCMLKHTALAIVQNLMGAQPPARFFREARATASPESSSWWADGEQIELGCLVRQCCAYPCVMKESRQRSSTARSSRGAVVMRQLVLKTHSNIQAGTSAPGPLTGQKGRSEKPPRHPSRSPQRYGPAARSKDAMYKEARANIGSVGVPPSSCRRGQIPGTAGGMQLRLMERQYGGY